MKYIFLYCVYFLILTHFEASLCENLEKQLEDEDHEEKSNPAIKFIGEKHPGKLFEYFQVFKLSRNNSNTRIIINRTLSYIRYFIMNEVMKLLLYNILCTYPKSTS